MKINVKLWMTISVISLIVIFLKNYDFEKDKKYTFDRIIDKNISIKEDIDNRIPKINNLAKITDKLICNYELSNYDSVKNLCNMNYYDINHFDLLNKFSFYIPKSAQISYCDSLSVFYIDKYNIFSYTVKDKINKKIELLDFKIYAVLSLDNKSSKLLCFGENKINSTFHTGFYILDLNTNKIILSKMIENNINSKISENFLIYSGKFSVNDSKTISYCCDKFSKIFFFNDMGKFTKEIITNDKAPKPKLVTNNESTFYQRGSTYNTNSAVLKNNDTLLIFSSRTVKNNVITIDAYSFKSSKYLFSSELSYNNKKSVHIYSATKNQTNLILFFDEGISLFKTSF
jgi:hypothetical protein